MEVLYPSLPVGTSLATCPRSEHSCSHVASQAWCREEPAMSNTIGKPSP